ncbi:MAG: hypothetical protein LBF81_05585 [Prevotellaceae bacterium]|jgi:hypothetical protein|nr:hypothetical protein [Prevotellaceae bacterium]
MKKFYFLFAMLASIATSAQVTVSNMATDYTTKQASFTVSWTSAPHNNQIWVIVDYIKVAGATTVGRWSPATVSSVTPTGTTARVSGRRGFWLNTSDASGSANVIATLSLAADVEHFNWCAYALNTPPKAVLQANGTYKLQGTPPFTVNGTTLGAGVNTFGAGTCITSLGDATDNPTFIPPDAPVANTTNPAARCGAGAVTLSATASGGTTTAMTYTWIVGANAAQKTTTGSLSLSSVAVGSTTYSVTVTNAAGCTSAAKTGTITVHGLPEITLTTANSSQTVTYDDAIAQIEYTTTNASGATLTAGSFPDGVSGTWSNGVYTISGTPTAIGTFNYTVTTTNNLGWTNASATGTLTINLNCTNCAIWTTCDDFKMVSSVSYENTERMSNMAAERECQRKGDGWRVPSAAEIACMCENKNDLPGGYLTDGRYWYDVNKIGDRTGACCYFSDCDMHMQSSGFLASVKCVK